MIEGKTIFITGGAGFIGSSLVRHLVDNNHIIIYDNFVRSSLIEKKLNDHSNLTIIEGDILDYELLYKSMIDAEMIIHCAAIAGIDTVIQKPVSTMKVNMIGSANILEAASYLKKIERLVCFSTSEVFGQHSFRSDEADNTIMGKVGEARWTYAVSKLAVEHLAIAYFQERSIPISVVRPFNVYGPGQVGEGALKTFVIRSLMNKPIKIHGDGTQIRAWCYLKDMIDGLLLIMTHPEAIGESFNIGNQKAVVTIFGLANTVLRVLNSESLIVFTKKDYADVELRVPKVQKAYDLLGYEPKVDLEDGIKLTADYYKKMKKI